MSAEIKEYVKIKVLSGDAISNNRVSGKSNTGTYFICSSKDFVNYENYFNDNVTYYLDIDKISIYKKMVDIFLKIDANNYPDKMENFDEYCFSLMSIKNNPNVKIDLRINDTRYFLRFCDNEDMIVNRLRAILYADYSLLVFEKGKNGINVYPEFNYDMLKDRK